MTRTLAVLAWLAMLTTLSSCARNLPFRTEFRSPPPVCDTLAARNEKNLDECSRHRHIRSDDYDLMFVEFDDQGLLFPERAVRPRARDVDWAGKPCIARDREQMPGECHDYPQIDQLVAGLERIADEAGDRGLSVVLFAHGWRHNAAHDDDNLSDFRQQLQVAAAIERSPSGNKRRVVGIYLGWRGRSLDLPVLDYLSFWGRKGAAHRVAEGTARELLARLHAFWSVRNADAFASSKLRSGARPKDRFMLIGHSFGGLVLFHALSTNLIVDLSSARTPGQGGVADLALRSLRQQSAAGAPPRRFFDMVVLLNPAFEAVRYSPLHRILESANWSRYSAPMLVLLTSDSDWATRIAFQFGRFVNTLVESEVSPEERDVIKMTPGHVRPYVTHFLERSRSPAQVCPGWQDPFARNPDGSIPEEATRIARIEANFELEKANSLAFFQRWGAGSPLRLQPKWTRTFCGGAELRHDDEFDLPANSPIWNVRVTDPTIISGHNDISQPILTHLLRQLYVDALQYPYLSD